MARVPEDVESVGAVSHDGMSPPPPPPSLSGSSDRWRCCGSDYPRQEIVFLAQVLTVYAVTIASIYNLTVGDGRSDRELWIALLSSALGYMLPGPALGGSKAPNAVHPQ